MGLRDEVRLLRHGRDWRGRSRVPRSAEQWVPKGTEDFTTGWARTPPAQAARAVLQRGFMKPFIWGQSRVHVEGREYLDELHGPAVFIANHSSHLDTPLILGALPPRITRHLAVGAAADYFFDSRVRAAATTLLFNAFPVERYGARRFRSPAADLVDQGWSLLLYPEGGRSPDGFMRVFKLGAAQLCVLKKVPAVPIALRGAYAAMPRGAGYIEPGRPRLSVRIGRPVHQRPDEGVREFRDRLGESVARLWAEDDLGWYGSLRAAADGTLGLPKTRSGTLPSTPAGPPLTGDVSEWRRIWESTRPRVADEAPREVWGD